MCFVCLFAVGSDKLRCKWIGEKRFRRARNEASDGNCQSNIAFKWDNGEEDADITEKGRGGKGKSTR